METGVCVNCGPLPSSDFYFRNKLQGTLQGRCRKCSKEYSKRHYAENKAVYKEHSKINNKRHRALNYWRLTEYLSRHPCVDCGEEDPVVLEFDHRISRSVSGKPPITRMLAMSWDKILKEISCCEVRCANCHTRKTAKDRGWRKMVPVLGFEPRERGV